MKTRGQTYSQEAASLLRDISMYKALREGQLLRLYPKREDKIENLLAYLVKQGRILREGDTYFASPGCVQHVDKGLMAAVWVLADFAERVEFHAVDDFPAKIIFFANDEVYQIVYAESGKETLLSQVMDRREDEPPHYLVLVDDPEQINGLELPNVCGYCTASPDGEVQYYQKE